MSRPGHGGAAGALALAALLAGCPAEPLDRPLAPEATSPRGLELYLPAGRIAGLGPALLEALRSAGQAELVAEVPRLEGTLGDGEASYGLAAQPIALSLVGLDLAPSPDGVRASATVAELKAAWALDLVPLDGVPRTCALGIQGEPRTLEAAFLLGVDAEGRPAFVPTGRPALLGPAAVVSLDPACTVLDTSALVAEVGAAVEQALQDGLGDLVAHTGDALGMICGLTVEGTGYLADGFRFAFRSRGATTSLGDGRLRVGLEGGFEGDLSPCVPLGLAAPAPGAGEPADFADLLPGSGGEFGLALAVPRATMEQGLRAAHRAGLLCRRVSEVPLEGVSLAELLPSLEALGSLNGARVAVWPAGAPELSLEPPAAPEERLPRAVVRLPGVSVDVFADLDGADVRALGCEAEVFLTLAPSLDADGLHVRLVEARVGNLEISFALLPSESGTELRQAAAALLGRLSEMMVAGLGALPLPRPVAGSGEVLEALTDTQAVVIYLAP